MQKKVLFSLLVIVALLLAACPAPAAAPAAQAPAAAPAQPVTSAVTETTATTATTGAAAAPAAGDFKGVEINVLTFTGPQIAEPLQRRGKEFSDKTGAKVNVTVVPFADLYQKILGDVSTGTNAFDVY